MFLSKSTFVVDVTRRRVVPLDFGLSNRLTPHP
jgi:hypothetical protein